MKVSDGMNYAPKGKAQPVVKPGEFIFSAAHLDHGHIYGMTNGLLEAGGTLKYVYDPDPKKVEAFVKAYPQVKVARSEEELLNDKETNMVCGAAITNERCALGLRAMQAGKDYFTDKAPFTTLEQLDSAKKMVAQTGKKYMVYYGERLHVEGAVLAGNLIEQGAIGKVIHVEGFGPHRLGAAGRPQWFFERRSTAASSAISAATKSSSTCSMRARRTAPSPAAALPTTRIRSTRSWTTSATAPSTVQTARRSTSAWTGSRRTACGRGATGAPSSSARRGTLKSASMWMSVRSATAATMCSSSTTKASNTSTQLA